jgi:hypothetical protein
MFLQYGKKALPLSAEIKQPKRNNGHANSQKCDFAQKH